MANQIAASLFRNPVFKFFASLKLAVFSLLSLSAVLGTATVLESLYGSRAVYLMVYGTWWFYGLLGFLATNVLCAALSRFPWKRRQIGFVVTHTGILVILFGSYLTMQFGVDGNLPVVEGDSDGRVILTGLQLTVEQAAAAGRQSFPVPEEALAKKGNFMAVSFDGGDALAVTEWIPRAVQKQQFVPSPTPGVGAPTIHIEVGNSRFHLDEWLSDSYPGKGSELNLGPATLSFRKLWSLSEERAFLAASKSKSPGIAGIGYLIVDYRGKTYRLPIDSLVKKWRQLGSEDLKISVDRYLPYAIVQEGQLVSKSNEPINPAVQVLVRNMAGTEEKHSVFAVFPEFSTMHKSQSSENRPFGLKLRMVSSAAKGQKPAQGERGRLELAQSVDDNKLLYRVFAKSGETNASGEVKLNHEVATGWMDLKFKVVTWFPSAVSQIRPLYVEQVAGTDNNFLSSLFVEPRSRKNLAAGKPTEGFWLSEGETRSLWLGERNLTVGLTRHSMVLPFELFLEKFTIGNDPGSTRAATYESRVKVKDATITAEKSQLISMNEPMEHGGYTFYQASYQLREGQPPVSVFSVNYDPGRWLKYIGSILMCLGILIMFWLNPHYWDLLLGSKRSHP